MIVLGLDPGTNESAIVHYDGSRIALAAILQNEEMLKFLDVGLGCDSDADQIFSAEARTFHTDLATASGRRVMAIEWIESFGMPVGREVFETVFWCGRFAEIFPWEFAKVPRRVVKQHLCHTARATDANIRQALIDRFGPVGTKKEPGVLYGIKSHAWAALAVAVTWYDLHGEENPIPPGVNAEF